MLEHVLCPAPVLRALLDEDVRFTANMGRVRCFENSQDDVDETLQIMSRIGVRQFHFCMRGIRWTRILPSEALDGSVFVSVSYPCKVSRVTRVGTVRRHHNFFVDVIRIN